MYLLFTYLIFLSLFNSADAAETSISVSTINNVINTKLYNSAEENGYYKFYGSGIEIGLARQLGKEREHVTFFHELILNSTLSKKQTFTNNPTNSSYTIEEQRSYEAQYLIKGRIISCWHLFLGTSLNYFSKSNLKNDLGIVGGAEFELINFLIKGISHGSFGEPLFDAKIKSPVDIYIKFLGGHLFQNNIMNREISLGIRGYY